MKTIYSNSHDDCQLYSQIEEIVGAMFVFEHIIFLTKWKHSEDIRLVESRVMKKIHTQMVINYYEKILFHT